MLQQHDDAKKFFAHFRSSKTFSPVKKHGCIIILMILFIVSCKTRQPLVSNVPVKVIVDTTKKTVAVNDSITAPQQKTFHISLLLPLSFDQQFKTDSSGNDADILPSSLPALNFYEGFLLASDSSKARKYILQYSVFDTDRDSISMWKLLNSETVSKSDLVIGMLSASWNIIAAKISSIRHYEIFLLQGNSSNCLFGNEQTFLFSPNNSTQCKLMSAYLNDNFKNSNQVIIFRDNNKKETDLADLFYAELDSLSNHTSTKKVNYSQGGFGNLKSTLVTSKKNILIIPTSDESYLSSLLKKLAELKEYNFVIAGLPTWEYFESIDPDLMESFNTHIFNTSYIDYGNSAVKKFRKEFNTTYHADPVYTAFLAYDIMRWIQSNTDKEITLLDHYRASVVSTTNAIKPVKICNTCGFENYSISVLKFKNGLLEKVNR